MMDGVEAPEEREPMKAAVDPVLGEIGQRQHREKLTGSGSDPSSAKSLAGISVSRTNREGNSAAQLNACTSRWLIRK